MDKWNHKSIHESIYDSKPKSIHKSIHKNIEKPTHVAKVVTNIALAHNGYKCESVHKSNHIDSRKHRLTQT